MITVQDLSFQGKIPATRDGIFQQINDFSYSFEFGKSYLLDDGKGYSGWALSWIVGGALRQTRGEIFLDEQIYPQSQRQQQSWLIRHHDIKRFGLFSMSVKAQIEAGLRHANPYHLSLEELKDLFRLTSRITRPVAQLSAEAWSASCAIGLAHGKRVFCFPSLKHWRPGLIDEYRHLWFEDHIRHLTARNCLVLIPAPVTDHSHAVVDEIVRL